ncbi:MAG TPA: LON peptidase substrate-binding domain-containing protein [Mycobacteriales bacterium]|nr:LON peptidase substrate-binding domain-containing protein [Mycobacteriales bacterium]
MPARLPLFPLGLVLVPGLVLPLHVFEERYRVLVHDLLALPEEEREFGVVAIRSGREVGEDGVLALHEVGCTARLRHAEPYEDGRFDLVTTGAERFRLVGFAHDKPYLVGEVEALPEAGGRAGEAEVLVAAVQQAIAAYVEALAGAGADQPELPELPDDARTLSYLVCAAVRADLDDRQGLLELPDDAGRLRAGLALLRREARLLRTLSAVPAPELTRAPLNPN